MKIPKVFLSEKDLDKKIEELLTKKILDYNSKNNKTKIAFELNVIKYGEEFVIKYPINTSKNVTGKEIKIIQPKIGKNGLKDLISLSESISFYHNQSATLSATIKGKNGHKKGICTVPLDHSLSIDELSRVFATFYPDSVDKIKSVKVKY